MRPASEETGGTEVDFDGRQQEASDSNQWDFSDLWALFLNCTLKLSPELSHTEGLIRFSRVVMETHGVSVEELCP
jgi:hypothetical protein